MPVNRKMMKSLKDQYGKSRGEDVYYALENKKKQGYNSGGYHIMPDGTKMKGAKHGYKHGGYVKCGASNPASRKK